MESARVHLKRLLDLRESRVEDFVGDYYRGYVRWAKFWAFFPWNRGKSIKSFEEYFAEFDGSGLTVGEGFQYAIVASWGSETETALKELIALCEASVDGSVAVTPKHCQAIGHPRNPLPKSRREREMEAARRELAAAIAPGGTIDHESHLRA